MREFSITNRHEIVSKLKATTYDLVIIGGGITGAGIALDAASRGLKTALIEKNDFAFGTSSRSTKLIHGGLRYLKQLEFGLVKEVGSERAIVHRLAPHLVIPEKMLLPLSEKKGLGYWLTSLGLMVYDYLAGVHPADQRRMLTRPQTLRHEPLLKSDDIKGGAIYAEYRTDDARLTIEIMKTAYAHGADIISYARVNDFVYEAEKIQALNVRDQLSGDMFAVRATAVVSAAGPWVDQLREVNKSRMGKRLHLTKGVHVVVPREKLPVQQSIYFDVDDGRMIFAIPRGRITYIGTTDTTYNGPIDEVTASAEDAAYLIAAVNATFPKVRLQIKDIESSWAGLRPLIHEEGKSASQLSRKDEIFESHTGLISIAGGKLTGYRKMAERVVNLVIKKYFAVRNLPKCHTQRIKLAGGDFHSKKDVRRYVLTLNKALKIYNLSDITVNYLVSNYGKQTDLIVEYFKQFEDVDTEFRLLKAELMFCLRHEMVVTLLDFFVRRTGLAYFHISKVHQHKAAIASFMQSVLNIDDENLKKQLSDLDQFISQIKTFK
jgi:glycerol-3-phosphate dehydrogenase